VLATLTGKPTTGQPGSSVVELVMLLCSQEWQTSLQKHAGLAFIELVNEGRLLAHATREHLVKVANEARFILQRQRADDLARHAEFTVPTVPWYTVGNRINWSCSALVLGNQRKPVQRGENVRHVDQCCPSQGYCSLSQDSGQHFERTHQQPRCLETKRTVNATRTSFFSIWTSFLVCYSKKLFRKLDSWEDDSRRRRRLVPNPLGTSHPDATLKSASDSIDFHMKNHQSIFKINTNAEKLEDELSASRESLLLQKLPGKDIASSPLNLGQPEPVLDEQELQKWAGDDQRDPELDQGIL